MIASLPHCVDALSSRRSPALSCWLLIALLGTLDFLTGYEAGFAYFYLLPVCIASWFGGAFLTLLIAGASAVTWQLANDLAGEPHSSVWIALWNDLLQLLFFLTVGFLLRRIKSLLLREMAQSRTDWLTGLLNRRAFHEVCERELARLGRGDRGLLLGYVDLDRFKEINDTRGHAEGDRVLRDVAEELRRALRRSDVVARMGGDEFAFLLPSTPMDAAPSIAIKLLQTLRDMSARNDWCVGASLGILAVQPGAVPSLEEAFSAADALMYRAKADGRGQFKVKLWTAPAESSR